LVHRRKPADLIEFISGESLPNVLSEVIATPLPDQGRHPQGIQGLGARLQRQVRRLEGRVEAARSLYPIAG